MTLEELGKKTLGMFTPPSDETVSEWADHNMIIVGKGASEPGPWRTDRAPYQKEIMDAFTQRGVHDIVVMSAAQVGKTNIIMNMMGRLIDLDPGPSLMVMPTEDDVDGFSKERLQPTMDAVPVLKEKVFGGNESTIRFKNFNGGFISLTGAMSPGGLKSRPIQYLFLDEVDGYPVSAGVEGDPVNLAVKRTQNFTFAKRLYTSTPTLLDSSRIYKLFLQGTQEEWRFRCAGCGGEHEILFDDIRFEKKLITDNGGGKPEYKVTRAVWKCPDCGKEMTEYAVRRAPARWVAKNPEALGEGFRSFHLNAFWSPWTDWRKECKKFLDAKDDPERLKTFYNLELGLPFERRGLTTAIPEALYLRRERYKAEVPNGVIVITIGMDVQDNRLEYEVRGWGRNEESWGIQYGVIPGRADDEAVWADVDELIDREWKMENGKRIRAAVTFIDCGGHFCDAVVEHCAERRMRRVYPIRGDNKDTGPLVRHTKSTKKGLNLFILNVYVGKRAVLYNAGIKEPGKRYMHFSDAEEAGYDERYFRGLISEQVRMVEKKGGMVEEWVKIHERNEPLDCANYARSAFLGFRIDLDAIEKRLYGEEEIRLMPDPKKPRRPKGLISAGVRV